MEEQVLHLLQATQLSEAQPRQNAELQLKKLYGNHAFPAALGAIASHKNIGTNDRVAALLVLKQYVNIGWSPSLEDFAGQVLLPDDTKEQVRNQLLGIVYDSDIDSKVTASTANVIAIVAKSDFPEEWPGVLDSLLGQLHQGDVQVQAILVVLGELINAGLDEEQFYQYGTTLVNSLQSIAVDSRRRLMVRAHAVNIFRSCFDFVENLKDNDEDNIKHFARGVTENWAPFFLSVIKEGMPQFPTQQEEDDNSSEVAKHWRGIVALKVQVVLTLAKIQSIFPDLIAADEFFNAVWDSVQAHGAPYYASYVEGSRQGGLINTYQLQYTFDFLVIEEIDYLQALLEAPKVKQQLDSMLSADQTSNGNSVTQWISTVLGTLVTFSSITNEAEEMWSFDFNVFLSEETFAETNNSPRSVCAGFVWKLCSWFPTQTLESLLGCIKPTFENASASWREKEAALFTLQQVAEEAENESRSADDQLLELCVNYTRPAVHDENQFLRARGHITMGAIAVAWLANKSGPSTDLVTDCAVQTLRSMDSDSSDIVKTACIRVMREYLSVLPGAKATELQADIINSIAKFLSAQDLEDMDDIVDLVDVILQTLRDTIMANASTCLDHNALDVLIMIVKYGAARDNHSSILIDEAFEYVAAEMAKQGPEMYARLCGKIMPSLMAAFDIEDPSTKEKTALTDVSCSIVKILAENAKGHLPQGFVAASMPRLCRIIFSENDFYVKQESTLAIKHMLTADKDQVFGWTDPQTHKNGLEMCFMIIGHLLGPGNDEASAAEVGELAVSVIDQAGAAALGSSMHDLLRVLAERLSTSEHITLIQSLSSVFARLSLLSVQEVLDFLASLSMGPVNGLEVVLQKWLENSASFVGFDSIRENISALVAIYKTQDPRLDAFECKGDLVADTSSRIRTRSMAKNAPIRYTRVSVPLKIVKNLIAELLPYGDPGNAFAPMKSPAIGHKAPSSDGSWESDDEDGILTGRQVDDATQKFLVEFFRAEGADPKFQALYGQLTDAERKRTQDAVDGWARLESQKAMIGGASA